MFVTSASDRSAAACVLLLAVTACTSRQAASRSGANDDEQAPPQSVAPAEQASRTRPSPSIPYSVAVPAGWKEVVTADGALVLASKNAPVQLLFKELVNLPTAGDRDNVVAYAKQLAHEYKRAITTEAWIEIASGSVLFIAGPQTALDGVTPLYVASCYVFDARTPRYVAAFFEAKVTVTNQPPALEQLVRTVIGSFRWE